MAGLDLAFTKNKTHSLSCKFEKDALLFSDRFSTLEKASYKMLDIKNTEIAEGYKTKVLTDSKMKMFAWWFESKIEEYSDVKTYNFMPQGLKIPNMSSIERWELLKLLSKNQVKDKKKIIDMILEKGFRVAKMNKKTVFFDKISSSFMEILVFVNEALTFLISPQKNIIYQLQTINSKIKKNKVYSHTGFNAIIKSVEAEFEAINTTYQIDETKLKKIKDYYILLKKTLEESVILLEGVKF